MKITSTPVRPGSSLLAAAVLGSVLAVAGVATPALADTVPVDATDPATPATVSADPLPTTQIDGVAWAQVVVGDTVYVAGKFTNARPAGAKPGVSTVTRNNLLAYDIRTGVLRADFVPDLNAQALTIAASPDGSRIYVGGDFTTADGQPRSRLAAYDTRTGALVPDFAPEVSSQVRTMVASNDTVWFGGAFYSVGDQPRTRMAAVSSSGALLPWAPVPGLGTVTKGKPTNEVTAMTLTLGGSQVVVGGRFGLLNGVASVGVGALDAVTGATRPFAVGQMITNQGTGASVTALSVKDGVVYGNGYDFYGPGNLEGSFAAQADGGALVWFADCHGDTYSSAVSGGALYTAGHAHVCSNIGGFPENNPRTNRSALAFSLAATGVNGSATLANNVFVGAPAPSQLIWYPAVYQGTFTGQAQAAWSVAANDAYVVYGGEFPQVGSTLQQGLVRFAVPSIAPNKVGPTDFSSVAPTLEARPRDLVRVTWKTTYDRDNATLVYKVFRNGDLSRPIFTTSSASAFWDVRTLSFDDPGATPGQTNTYRIAAFDPFGNAAYGATASISVPAAVKLSPYDRAVLTDGAGSLWRLGEAAGASASVDVDGTNPLRVSGGVTAGVPGAIVGSADTAYRFDGVDGYLATTNAVPGPQTFSVESWVRTTSTRGGILMGFGNKNDQLSGSYDRHLELQADGRLAFGVYPGREQTILSTAPINDGQWHHVVGTLSGQGQRLYVDGVLVGQRDDVTSAQSYDGFWRLGGDRVWNADSRFVAADLDEAAIYPSALTADQVADHDSLGRTGTAANRLPTARATSTVADLAVQLDGRGSSDTDGRVVGWAWDFGDGVGATGSTTSHTYAAAGTYLVRLTVTDDQGATGAVSKTVTVTAAPPPPPTPNVAPTAAFSSSASDLAASFDGSGSADSDGTVASYAWTFGDGVSGSGAAVSHSYAAAGTFTVTLTVTDNQGATGAVSRAVTVTAAAPPPPPPAPSALASDTFARATTGGLGTAQTGGRWRDSNGGTASRQSTVVNPDGTGSALFAMRPGDLVGSYLDGVSASAVDLRTSLTLDATPTGNGLALRVIGRQLSSIQQYRGRLWFRPDGSVTLGVTRVSGSAAENPLGNEVLLPGGYLPGQSLELRLRVVAEPGGGTRISLTVWAAGTAEPTTPNVTRVDSTPALQAPGTVGLTSYLFGNSGRVTTRYGAFTVTAP